MKANEFIKKYGLDCAKQELIVIQDYIDDLKRLIKAHDLVEKLGGLEVCKQKIEKAKLIPKNRFICFVDKEGCEVRDYILKQAIADVEGCL